MTQEPSQRSRRSHRSTRTGTSPNDPTKERKNHQLQNRSESLARLPKSQDLQQQEAFTPMRRTIQDPRTKRTSYIQTRTTDHLEDT